VGCGFAITFAYSRLLSVLTLSSLGIPYHPLQKYERHDICCSTVPLAPELPAHDTAMQRLPIYARTVELNIAINSASSSSFHLSSVVVVDVEEVSLML